MKKILLFFFAIFFLFQNSSAQSYDVQMVPFLPLPFNNGNVIPLLTDDQYSDAIPLGFDFCFFGQLYDSILISSNGYITFDISDSNGYSPWAISAPIPSPQNPMNSIMFPWQDLNPGSGGVIYYALYGQAPCRTFVVTYSNLSMFGCTFPEYKNHLVLYENSNVIETYIESKPLCPSWNGGKAIHGLHNADGTEAVVVPGRNAPTQWEAYSDAWRFTPLICEIDTNSCPLILDTANYALITGKLFIDTTSDCAYDPGEFKIANEIILLSPSDRLTFTNNMGEYNFFVADTGAYQVNFTGSPFMQVICNQNTVHIPVLNTSDILDLPVESFDCVELLNELDILVVRPCSTSNVYITLENQGTINSGIINLKVLLPPELIIVSASRPYSVSGDTLVFTLGGLNPSQDVFTSITVNASCDLAIGELICAQSWVGFDTTDCTVLTTGDEQGCTTVVNSYDPNDKRFSFAEHVLTDGYFVLDTITENDSLVYMIRFQNTGTAVAYDVEVTDEFPLELDLLSFDMLSASDSYQLSIDERMITWTFNNIMLPDSASDPVNSIGFVKFKIRQTGGTPLWEEINNRASIFFDFNPPVITDTAICVLGLETSIRSPEKSTFVVYPNPSTGQITVVGNTNSGDRLILFDITGRMLRSYILNKNSTTLNLGEVSAGFYTFSITDKESNIIVSGKIQLIDF